jgi:hypothetical protein
VDEDKPGRLLYVMAGNGLAGAEAGRAMIQTIGPHRQHGMNRTR